MTTVLTEGFNLVHGDRGESYGDPSEDFARIGKLWAIVLKMPEITPQQVAMCMIALKLSREVNRHKRDNLVDIGGYTETLAMIEDD